MITIIDQGMNTILEANGYPELGVRIGIDIGENAIVRYGLKQKSIDFTERAYNTKMIQSTKKNNDDVNLYNIEKNSILSNKKPHLDILGYTINIASKMTNYANPNQIIIGEEVYRNLDIQTKRNFKRLNIENIEWNFINNSTGNTYELYLNNSTQK